MTKDYKKYICLNEKCGYEWQGDQKRPRCTKCGLYQIQTIEPKHKKKVENEQIEEFEEVKEDEPIFEDLVLNNDMETQEVTYFTCEDCGFDKIEKGDLYCQGCGEALDIDWSKI